MEGLAGRFRLSGFKGNCEFYYESASDWIDQLRKVCVLQHFTHEYIFDKMIGRGNFAKVSLRCYQL